MMSDELPRVVRECLESAQAMRLRLRDYDDDDGEFRGVLGERLHEQERMLELLLAAVCNFVGKGAEQITLRTFEHYYVEEIGYGPGIDRLRAVGA